jgi:peptidoglycan-associated lipoprotein
MGIMRAGAVLTLIGLSATGCATKGYVMQQIRAAQDTSRTQWTAGDAAVRSDLTTKVSGVQTDVDSVKMEVASLRRDLDMLRDSVGATITALEHGMEFAMPVTFAFDDATVRTQDRPKLELFAKVVNRHYAGSTVTVEGFADPAGSAAYNRELSKNRAESVADYLARAGLSSAITLRSVGMGETRQVVRGAARDMPGAESNRRVVFVIESGAPEMPASVTR